MKNRELPSGHRRNLGGHEGGQLALQYFYYLRIVFRRVCKIGKSDYLYVLPSVRMEQLVSHWTDFHEIWYLKLFFNLSRIFKFN